MNSGCIFAVPAEALLGQTGDLSPGRLAEPPSGGYGREASSSPVAVFVVVGCEAVAALDVTAADSQAAQGAFADVAIGRYQVAQENDHALLTKHTNAITTQYTPI